MICSVPRNSPMGDYENFDWRANILNQSERSVRWPMDRLKNAPHPSRRFFKLLLPQSPRGFSALTRLYYLARPTKTAMLRRLNNSLRPICAIVLKPKPRYAKLNVMSRNDSVERRTWIKCWNEWDNLPLEHPNNCLSLGYQTCSSLLLYPTERRTLLKGSSEWSEK